MHKTGLLIFLLVAFATKAFGQNAGLDPSFARGGILIDSQENFQRVCDLAIQPDGKIIAAGFNYVTRYLPDGKRDSAFGEDGLAAVYVLTDSSGGYASHVLLLPGGKIMLTLSSNGKGDFAIQLKPDGSLDSSYGKAGKVNFCCGVLQAAIQPDGKLVTAGIEDNDYVAVRRITSNGLIDSAFGTNGKSRFRFSTAPNLSIAGIGVLSNGNVGVAGGINGSIFYSQLLANGQLDSSFCNNGICYASGAVYCRDATIFPDGKVLVTVGGLSDDACFLTRLKRDATPDSSFSIDKDGVLAVPGLRIIKVLQMPDERIICVGMWNEHFAVVRILKDGQGMDTTFGNRGIITTQVSTGYYERAYSLALQPDGKIIAGGVTQSVNTRTQWDPHRASIVRYLPDAPLGIGKVPYTSIGTLKVYPNPASTLVTVMTPVSGTLQLYNVEGRLLRQQPCAGAVQRLDIASLPKGTYLLRLQAADKSYSSLFVKE